jgi:pimeloyl-ACP methyl ester carboxylesterase
VETDDDMPRGYRPPVSLAVVALAAIAAVAAGCAHGSRDLVLADAAANRFVHELSRHRASAGHRTVWYYVAGSTGEAASGTDLLVLVDGSRLASVLGERRGGDLHRPGLAYVVLRHGRPGLDLLAVEPTFFVEPFANHARDRRVLEHYTLEDRVLATATAVDDHLATHAYGRVVLLGHSEGAAIVGRVYRTLRNRAAVTRLALVGNGGLSQRAQLEALARSSAPLAPVFRARVSEAGANVREIEDDPLSIEKWWLGWPFRRWSSFLAYEPLEDLRTVEIPILCAHGTDDTSSPVESSRFLATELAKAGRTDVRFVEYPGLGHGLDDPAWRETLAALFP